MSDNEGEENMWAQAANEAAAHVREVMASEMYARFARDMDVLSIAVGIIRGLDLQGLLDVIEASELSPEFIMAGGQQRVGEYKAVIELCKALLGDIDKVSWVASS